MGKYDFLRARLRTGCPSAVYIKVFAHLISGSRKNSFYEVAVEVRTVCIFLASFFFLLLFLFSIHFKLTNKYG